MRHGPTAPVCLPPWHPMHNQTGSWQVIHSAAHKALRLVAQVTRPDMKCLIRLCGSIKLQHRQCRLLTILQSLHSVRKTGSNPSQSNVVISHAHIPTQFLPLQMRSKVFGPHHLSISCNFSLLLYPNDQNQ